MRREFNPEVMHESRELQMQAPDTVIDLQAIQEAYDLWQEENQPDPEAMALAAQLPPMEEDEELEEFDVAKARAFFALHDPRRAARPPAHHEED